MLGTADRKIAAGSFELVTRTLGTKIMVGYGS